MTAKEKKRKSKLFSDVFIEKLLPKLTGHLNPTSLKIIKRLFRLANIMNGDWALFIMKSKLKNIADKKEKIAVFEFIIHESSRRKNGNLHIPMLFLIGRCDLDFQEKYLFFSRVIGDLIVSKNPYEQDNSIDMLESISALMGSKFTETQLFFAITGRNNTSFYSTFSYKHEGALRLYVWISTTYPKVKESLTTYIEETLENLEHDNFNMFVEKHGRRRSMAPSDIFCLTCTFLLKEKHNVKLATLLRAKLGYFCGQYTYLLIAEINRTLGEETTEKTAHYFFTPNAFSFYLQNIACIDLHDFMAETSSTTIKTFCLETIASEPSSRDKPFSQVQEQIT